MVLTMLRNAISGGNTLGPLICGFIVSNLSWRWHKWIAVILTGLNFLTILLFVPETRYQRENSTTTDGDVSEAIFSPPEKIVGVDVMPTTEASDDGSENQQLDKKTWAQELTLWSGVPDTNLLKMFIRYVMVDLYMKSNVMLIRKQPIPYAGLSLCRFLVSLLFYFSCHCSSGEHLKPICIAGAPIQVESSN